MSRFARKIKRKTEPRLKCCGEKMTRKEGYGYVCEQCGKCKPFRETVKCREVE